MTRGTLCALRNTQIMTRTRIKICGITNLQDALCAARCGADALGFNLYAGSERVVGVDRIEEICAHLPPLVARVGLFVNPDRTGIEAVLGKVRFDLLQFHGDETNDFCSSFGLPWIKVLRVDDASDLADRIAAYPDSNGILLDTRVPGRYGGTGQTMDWAGLPRLDCPVILAGGLTPENVGEAIRIVRPWAVDVSGGVERDKGVKDHDRIRRFIQAVQAADREAQA